MDIQANKIVLKDVDYEEHDSSSTLTKAILNSVQNLFFLNRFELKDISLQINDLDVTPGKITVAGSVTAKKSNILS